MTAEMLREAATLMRARAEVATPGPWRDSSTEPGARFGALVADAPHPDRQSPDRGGWGWDDAYGGCLVGESLMAGDRAHIASWNPVVALAVADWLDDLYERITDTDYDEDDDLAAALRGQADVTDWPEVHRALAVARAYIGEPS